MSDVKNLLRCKQTIMRVREGDSVSVDTSDGKGKGIGAKAAVATRPGFMISNIWGVIHVSDEELIEARSRREMEGAEKPIRPPDPDELETDICDAPPLRVYRCECPKEKGYTFTSVQWWVWERAMEAARAKGVLDELEDKLYRYDSWPWSSPCVPIDWPPKWDGSGRCLECKQLLVVESPEEAAEQ